MWTVKDVQLTGILDSRRIPTVEAEIRLDDGGIGTASAPVAIAPGRRERSRSRISGLGALDGEPEHASVRERLVSVTADSQAAFDAVLEGLDLGANVLVALSVAFARARCAGSGTRLVQDLAESAGRTPRMPAPLMNVFSGGIHAQNPHMPFQEIMVVSSAGPVREQLRVALTVFDRARALVRERYGKHGYSSAGGLVVPGLTFERAFELLAEVIDERFSRSDVGIGVDVAAEHLCRCHGDDGSRYAVGGDLVTAGQLGALLSGLVPRYPMRYVEDPFDPGDVAAWEEFTARHRSHGPRVSGDDLFVTDAERMDGRLADSTVIKLTQCGTVTRGIAAARAARRESMALCVSHRSGETEDTTVCDLATALGAEFIKVGGPGPDRMSKFNQLLRLERAIEGPGRLT